MLGRLENHEKRNPNHRERFCVINKCQQIIIFVNIMITVLLLY